MRPGPLNALTDVTGLMVGHASDETLKSGVTVVTAQTPFTAAVHIMGGAPGTRETDLLAPDKTVAEVHAITLAGGSAFGLDAGSGVADALAARGIGFPVGPARVPIVPGAILFDLLNGGDKSWKSNPYKDLGAKALANASPTEARCGSLGAGTGAIAGALKGGIGTASLTLPGGHTVAALIACNSLGNTTVGTTPHFWAAPFEMAGEFGALGPAPAAPEIASTFATKFGEAAAGNTTIGIVATSARLTKPAAQRLATAAHDGLARAIVPAHTPMDGDLIFAAATGTSEAPTAEAMIPLCHAAALCAARATARAIFTATAASGDTVPTWSARHAP